MGQAYRL